MDDGRGRAFHRAYELGIILKGVDGVLETLGAVSLFLVPRWKIFHLVVGLTRHELSRDPNDWLASRLFHYFQHFSSDQKLFASAYLLAHGVVKIFLVANLLRGRLWAYPTALAVLSALIVYQAVRVLLRFSWGLLALTVFDLVIVLLIAREYRMRKTAGKH